MQWPLLLGLALALTVPLAQPASAMPFPKQKALISQNGDADIVQIHGHRGGRGHHYGWGHGLGHGRH